MMRVIRMEIRLVGFSHGQQLVTEFTPPEPA
jgi:hypothetical protein